MEKIWEQSDLILRLNRNISRLQQRLDALKPSAAIPREELRDTGRENLPWIYMITPTYARWTQKADLTRLAQTLAHVPNLHWIVVEDAERKTELVTRFLKRWGNRLRTTHLNIRTEEKRRCV